MRILIILLLVNSGVGFAGDVTELSPSEASSMNFRFDAWPGMSESEIEEHKKEARCTPVEFSMPLQISEEEPDWTQVLISGKIYLSGKVLTTTETFSFEIEGRNLTFGCFPFDPEYSVDLTLSYMPTDLKKFPLCPVAFSLLDFERFVNLENSK